VAFGVSEAFVDGLVEPEVGDATVLRVVVLLLDLG